MHRSSLKLSLTMEYSRSNILYSSLLNFMQWVWTLIKKKDRVWTFICNEHWLNLDFIWAYNLPVARYIYNYWVRHTFTIIYWIYFLLALVTVQIVKLMISMWYIRLSNNLTLYFNRDFEFKSWFYTSYRPFKQVLMIS